MRLKLITAPTIEPITLEEAKNHLKVDSGDDNALITNLIKAAREVGETITHRAFITQTWKLILDQAPAEIEIPKPPLQQIIDIKVTDSAGSETAVSDTLYWVDASRDSRGRVKLRDGCVWPDHRYFASFAIQFKGGYGDTASTVPLGIRQALLEAVAFFYDNRGGEPLPAGLVAAFTPFKVWKF